jgi:hypothetical protein
LICAQIKVDDFYRRTDVDDTRAIQQAFNYIDSLGHGSIEFTGTKTYKVSQSIELPRYGKGRRIIVINGNGCEIVGKEGINIFNRIPKDQKEALDKMMSTRFVINDFTFTSGNKAINLGATYGTSINRCNFVGQKIAAVDIQFGLNTEINHCISTNARKDAFVLRCGEDWGGNTINSQSNHSVINMCRVYAAKGAGCSFKILGSGGVVLRDIISEGSHEAAYAVYFDRQGSTTVRLFTIQNFHLEHRLTQAAIYLKHTGITTINGLFYQHAYKDFPLVHAAVGAEHITLKNIPHFVQGTIIKAENNETAWLVEQCAKEFYNDANWFVGSQRKLPFYFSGSGYRYQVKQKY